MSYMGLDVGTTGCKAVVFDEGGKQIASAYREYNVLVANEGWAELDSKDVCDKCFMVIREAAKSCPEDPVIGMGVSCQGEAFTPVDGKGNIIGNGMVSFDARAVEISKTWSEEFGRDKLYRITGHTAHPMFSIFKMIWLQRNRKELWEKSAKLLCYEDLIQSQLGLEPAIGWPLAGRTMLFNVTKHEWDDELLDRANIDRKKLARPLSSGSVAGKIPKEIAGGLGFTKEVTVVTAGHDQPCGALGSGAIKPGIAMYATGTVDSITSVFAEPVFSKELFEGNLCTYDHTLKGTYASVSFCLTGGNILKWFRDEFGAQEVEESKRTGRNVYEILLDNMSVKPPKILVLPYFTPTGTPYFDAEVSGAITGLRLTTKRGEILRALLEGVAFEMRLNIEILARSGIKIDELRAIGGGAKSRKWMQLKADVFGKPITGVAVTEGGCMGVAILAKSAVTGEDLASIVKRWVKTTYVLEPDKENSGFYDEQFGKYCKLYPAIRSLR